MKRGFTVVELLVVISIIALLSSLVFVQFQTARIRARDAEREEKIKTLQNALAIYVINKHNYPLYSGALTGSDAASIALLNSDVIPEIPLDPLNAGNFRYIYESTDGYTYLLTYYLETGSIPGKTTGKQTASP